MTFKIEFADCVKEHFKHLNASQRSAIMEGIKKQLFHEPLKETRRNWQAKLGSPIEIIVKSKNIIPTK